MPGAQLAGLLARSAGPAPPDGRKGASNHSSHRGKVGKQSQQAALFSEPAKRRHKRKRGPADADDEDDRKEDLGVAAAPKEADASAYEALVSNLTTRGTKYGEAMRRRQQQEEGDSESDEEEEEKEEDEDQDELEGEETGDETEDDEAGGSEGEDKAEHAGGRKKPRTAAATETEAAERDGAAAVLDDGGGEEEEGEEGDGDDDAGSDGEQGDAARTAGGSAAAAAVPADLPPDPWDAHVSRQLTDAEAAELRSGAGNPRFCDAASASASTSGSSSSSSSSSSYDGVWPHSRLQFAGCEAPPLRTSLAMHRVKERLQQRWREVVLGGGGGGGGQKQGASGAEPAGDADQTQQRTAKQSKQQKGDVRGSAANATASPSGSAAAAGSSSAAAAAAAGDFVSLQQAAFFSLCNSYADVLFTARPYPTDHSAPDAYLDAYLLHVLNHCQKTADRVKKNNERLRAAEAGGGSAPGETPRDQGFTRPKVLLLLPQRNMAFKVVVRLIQLVLKEEARADSVAGKAKFVEEFADLEGADGDDGEEDEKARARQLRKPADHRALFAGNVDDHFRLGIKLTRGSVRLYADLFDCDIVVASPVALATKLAEAARAAPGGSRRGKAAGGDAAGAAAGAARSSGSAEADFLSSIEVLIVDRADMVLMQNWSHVEAVVEALNGLPRAQHGVDIMRVREWYLSGCARLYRQTLLLSSFASPDINALFARNLANWAGRLRLRAEPPGVLAQVVPQVQQLYERIPAASPAAAAAARYDFFVGTLWPRIRDSAAGGLLLFVPSYFDFVRLRNFLLEEEASFVGVCEYSKPGDVTRSRSRFFHQQRRLLMYTERAHFYNRHAIRGIKDVLFYALPDHAHFYPEVLNLLEAGGAAGGGAGGGAAGGGGGGGSLHSTVTVLYTRYDALQLERVVGAARARKMLASDTSTFVFC